MSAIQLATRPDSVAVMTFDQPGSKANVLSTELWTDLESAIDSLAARTGLKGLVLASAKPGIFIAGADLKLLAAAAGPNDPAVRAFIELGLRVLNKLETLPYPTCAAINGAALGGGLEVALACDYRICGTGPRVQLGLPEVKLGLIPGWGGTQRLPRIIGVAKAASLLLEGRSASAEQAEATGLVGIEDVPDLVQAAAAFLLELQLAAGMQVVPDGQPDWAEQREDKALPIPDFLQGDVPTLAHDAPLAVREALRVMIEGANLLFRDAIRIETEAFLRLAGTDESKRLIAEFFASRKK